MKPKLFKKQMEDVEKDMDKNKEQLAKDDKIIAEYLAKNNIKAEKTKWGTPILNQMSLVSDLDKLSIGGR